MEKILYLIALIATAVALTKWFIDELKWLKIDLERQRQRIQAKYARKRQALEEAGDRYIKFLNELK